MLIDECVAVKVEVGGMATAQHSDDRESGVRRTDALIDRYLQCLGLDDPYLQRELARGSLGLRQTQTGASDDTSRRQPLLIALCDGQAPIPGSLRVVPEKRGTVPVPRQVLRPLIDFARIGYAAGTMFRRAKTAANPG